MTIGHNVPPADADPLRDRLAETHGELASRTADLVGALDRVPATLDESTHDKAAAFVKQIKTHAKTVDAARVAEKEPYLAGGRTVDAWFGDMADKLKKASASVEQRITAFLRAKAEAERKAREEAEKAARVEAERIAAAIKDEDDLKAALVAEETAVEASRATMASVADLARTRTSYGVTSTLRTEIVVSVIDKAAACRALAPFIDDDAMAKAGRAWLKANKAAAEAVADGRASPVAGLLIQRNSVARVA